MAKKKKQETKDAVMWIRLPKPMSLAELKKRGFDKVACYGGDTCIAATAFNDDSAIVVKKPTRGKIDQTIKDAGLLPQGRCFGGDSCIV